MNVPQSRRYASNVHTGSSFAKHDEVASLQSSHTKDPGTTTLAPLLSPLTRRYPIEQAAGTSRPGCGISVSVAGTAKPCNEVGACSDGEVSSVTSCAGHHSFRTDCGSKAAEYISEMEGAHDYVGVDGGNPAISSATAECVSVGDGPQPKLRAQPQRRALNDWFNSELESPHLNSLALYLDEVDPARSDCSSAREGLVEDLANDARRQRDKNNYDPQAAFDKARSQVPMSPHED